MAGKQNIAEYYTDTTPSEYGFKRFSKYQLLVENIPIMKTRGRVKEVIGLLIVSEGPVCKIGDICRIDLPERGFISAEVVGFRDDDILLAPIGSTEGLTHGCPVYSSNEPLSVMCSDFLLGRVLNGVGKPLDGTQLAYYEPPTPVMRPPFSALKRMRITEPLQTGVKAIDGTLTVGRGQRLAIMSGSGVGKSTLLSMIARNTDADINVIALIGERRLEVRNFLERDLGEEGLKKSVVIVATSDEPPLVRLKGAFVATTIAEYFRDQGKDVLLMVDSLTRLAHAQREIGLSKGEPPTTRGFPPSVFETLPKLLERSGTSDKGTITAFYNVLVEGDDLDEPITDAVRGIVDGHIVLSREYANRGHYPAIDVNASVSRLMVDVVSERHQAAGNLLKQLYAHYNDARDLITLGAYVKGSSPEIDRAIQLKPRIDAFLMQGIFDTFSFDDTKKELLSLFYTQSEVEEELSGTRVQTREKGEQERMGTYDEQQEDALDHYGGQQVIL